MSEPTEISKNSRELNRIYRHLLRNDRQVEQLQKELQDWRNLANRQFNELYYADLLHDTIINSTWLKDKSFSLHGWAANYSFMYMLYRILDNAKPQHILEMGMGQTSRLTSQYVAYCNTQATLDIIDNDVGWIETYKPQLAENENIKVYQRDLKFFTYEGIECRKYKDLDKVADNKKYDFIIVDGPYGGRQPFPRSNIIDIIENNNLSNDFIIIFDDAERKGEGNTIVNTMQLLKKQQTEYMTFQRNGIKTQQFITSLSKSFIQFL